MIALFESGNTRLHFSWWDGEVLREVVHLSYPGSIDSLKNVVSNLLGGTIPHKVAACSVSSQWREPLFDAINSIVPGKLHTARTASDLSINILYDKPETYGIDRALASYAAYNMYRNSCVVVDAGTAVTVDAIKHDGTVIGGYIFPGSTILASSLSSETDLPQVTLDEACEGIGNSTEASIRFGITMGFLAAVNSLVQKAMSTVDCDERVVITGGDAEYLRNFLNFPVLHKPYIILEALGLVAIKLPKYT